MQNNQITEEIIERCSPSDEENVRAMEPNQNDEQTGGVELPDNPTVQLHPPHDNPILAATSVSPRQDHQQSKCSVKHKRKSAKPKKVRTEYTPEQLEELERQFHSDTYPDEARRLPIALRLSLTEQQVGAWFGKRRSKLKRQQMGQPRNSLTRVCKKPVASIPSTSTVSESKNTQQLEPVVNYTLSEQLTLNYCILTEIYKETMETIPTEDNIAQGQERQTFDPVAKESPLLADSPTNSSLLDPLNASEYNLEALKTKVDQTEIP